MSTVDLLTIVNDGRRGSTGGASLDSALSAASYARSWMMERQKRIESAASSRVRFLGFVPMTSSDISIDSSEKKMKH